MAKPVIFFAFANSIERYLPNLKKEERALMDMALQLKMDQGLIDFIPPMQISSDDLFHYIAKIGEQINILHFSGHAASYHLELDHSQKYNIDQFCNLIGGLNHLKLVFLNGCSTKGMVDKLLAAGVQAVIATSESIDDYTATDFSIAFYHAFSTKGKSLRFAFNQAVSNLSNQPTEADKFIARSSMGRFDALAERDPLPWALYYNNDDQLILDWQWISEDAHPEFDEEINLKIESLRKNIADLNNQIKKLQKDKASLDLAIANLGGADSGNPAIAGLLPLIQDNITQQETLQAEISRQHSLIKAEINQHDKVQLKERLIAALNNLNYNTQIFNFEKILLEGKNYGAFILQGSGMCGQDILEKRLLDFAGIRYDYKEILIDFASKSHPPPASVKDIWARIQIDLQLPKDTSPEEIVAYIVTHHYKTPKDVIILFNNINIRPPDLNISLIKTFWLAFLELFQTLTTTHTLAKLFLFVLDKNCLIQKKDGVYSSNMEHKYLTAFAQEDIPKHATHLMPIVEPVHAAYLNQWRIDQKLPLDLGLTAEIVEALTGEEGKFILPTIKEICKQTQLENIYYENFQQYEYIIKL
ncbi:MAG TPA: CHAT domain-containing protein [Saprospiraceae bacterium]|nr:CHAT domain-containing protein [Saprospiraceae bacterium]